MFKTISSSLFTLIWTLLLFATKLQKPVLAPLKQLLGPTYPYWHCHIFLIESLFWKLNIWLRSSHQALQDKTLICLLLLHHASVKLPWKWEVAPQHPMQNLANFWILEIFNPAGYYVYRILVYAISIFRNRTKLLNLQVETKKFLQTLKWITKLSISWNLELRMTFHFWQCWSPWCAGRSHVLICLVMKNPSDWAIAWCSAFSPLFDHFFITYPHMCALSQFSSRKILIMKYFGLF